MGRHRGPHCLYRKLLMGDHFRIFNRRLSQSQALVALNHHHAFQIFPQYIQ